MTEYGVYFNVRKLPFGVTIGGRTCGGSAVAPKASRYLELQEDVDAKITSLGNQVRDSHVGSLTAQKIQRLHNYWLLGEADEVQIPEPQKSFLDYLFGKFGKGIVLDNGVDYNDHGDLPEKWGFARARIVTHPKRFYKKGDEWKVEAGEIKPAHDYVPRTGFPILTNDGDFNPETGFPFETDPKREVAEKSYTKKGVSPDAAEKAVSKFWSMNEGKGVVGVVAFCYIHYNFGRFTLGADVDPDRGCYNIGRLASRPRKQVTG